jgi:methionine synthase I (cobalamin-dependent)
MVREMTPLLDVLDSGRVLLMDGAMGTELQRLGLKDGENAAAWNVRHPSGVERVHRSYAAAGAQVFLTNTFLVYADSYRQALVARHRNDVVVQWATAEQRLYGVEGYRLAAIGPVAGNHSGREFDDLGQFFNLPWRESSPGPDPSPDGILLETCSTPRVYVAVRRVEQQSELPVLVSLAFRRNGRGRLVTASGHSPEWFARRAWDRGVAALGVNCGRDIGMDEVIEIIRRYRQVTNLPLFARPNAGTPVRHRRRWVYPATPEAMAERLPELLEAGVSMIGGCCGTTPAHIAAFRTVIDEWNARHGGVGTGTVLVRR